MVVEIDVARCTAMAIPSEYQSPLLIHANGVKTFKLATQLLEMIAGRNAQILVRRRIIQHLQPSKQPTFQIRRYASRMLILNKEGPQNLISKTEDHVTVSI